MQIPKEIRKSVVFIGFKNNDPDIVIGGTGFLVRRPSSKKKVHLFVVTAKHVVNLIQAKSSDGKLYIVINKKKGRTQIKTNIDDWFSSPDDPSVDASIYLIKLSSDKYDFNHLDPYENTLDSDTIKRYEIGPGDEVFLTGLFKNHKGTFKNLPIVRSGIISRMLEEKIYIEQLGETEVYLIETKSIGGLSGSPVFVYLGHNRLINGERIKGEFKVFVWMGIVSGHWTVDETKIDEASDSIAAERINLGISWVVPGTKILELINTHPYFSKSAK